LRFVIKNALLIFLTCVILFLVLANFPTFGNIVEAQYNYKSSNNHFQSGLKDKRNGNYLRAFDEFQLALKNARKSSNVEEECRALLELGIVSWNLGYMDDSLQFYKNANLVAKDFELREHEKLSGECLKIHELYSNAKKLRDELGELDKSISLFDRGIEISREIERPEFEIKLLRQLSFVYMEQNNLKEYEKLNQRALKLARAINHKLEMMRCLNNLGIYYDQIENYSQALITYEEASQLAQQLNRRVAESDIKNNISIIYKNLGEFDKAIDYLEEVIVIDRESGEKSKIAKALNNLGETHRRRALTFENDKDFETALKYFTQALSIAREMNEKETEVRILNNMGTVYADRSDYTESLYHFNLGLSLAEEIEDEESIGMLNNNIGIIHFNQGNYSESTKYYQRAIDLALKIEDEKTLWEAYLELARAYVKQGEYAEALRSFEESILIIENIRSNIILEELRASYLGTDKRIEAYQDLIYLLVVLNENETNKDYGKTAFKYLEKGKARAFLDQLESSQINISQHVDFILQNKEKQIQKEITETLSLLYTSGQSHEDIEKRQDLLQSKEIELENIKREIRSKSPAYANLFDPQIIELTEVQEELRDNKTAFFEYLIGKQKSIAFVITKNGYKIFKLPPKKEIEQKVSKYLEILSDKTNKDFNLGLELYNLLVAPGINDQIENIIFVPDDILNYLPFETLITQVSSNRWLICDYKIAYVPSITAHYEIINRKRNNGHKRKYDLLAIGDPYYGQFENQSNGEDNGSDFHFERLKYSKTEIEKISSQLSSKKIQTLVRKDASKKYLLAKEIDQFKIVHVAAHSKIDNKSPGHSYIALSSIDDQEENGNLYTSEIYNLALNSDLVALSACQTGLGKLVRGEGIEGINRAFFYAGSSAVLMSLWPVNDQATFQLMDRFYYYLNNGKSIMNSLRQAKLELINSDVLSHPFYWAGFIVSGKADQVIFPKKNRLYILLGFSLIFGTIAFSFFYIKRNRSFRSTSK